MLQGQLTPRGDVIHSSSVSAIKNNFSEPRANSEHPNVLTFLSVAFSKTFKTGLCTLRLAAPPLFVGREEQLKEMRELLSPKDIHHRIALAGLGGAGLVSCLNSHEYPKLTSNTESL